MPVSALDLVKKLMAKAGVKHEGELTADIPDEVATALDNQLLTIAAATNNHPDVKKVYFAQAYNGLDAEMNSIITEFGLTDEQKAEIERAGGSTKKAAAIARKLHELASKSDPKDKDAAARLNATITELNNKLAAEIKKQTDLEANYNKQLQGIKIKTKLQGMIAPIKTVYDEIPEAKEPAIQALIDKALQDSDAEFVFDEKENLSLRKKDGTNLFGENHTQITPQSFIDKTLSKILKVTNSAANNGINNNPAQPINGSQNTKNAALDAAIAESLQNYTQGTKVAV